MSGTVNGGLESWPAALLVAADTDHPGMGLDLLYGKPLHPIHACLHVVGRHVDMPTGHRGICAFTASTHEGPVPSYRRYTCVTLQMGP